MPHRLRLLVLASLAAAACPEITSTCTCGPDEVCLMDRCLPKACGETACRSGQGCRAGQCLDSKCLETAQCPAGQRCAGGACYPVECGPLECGLGDVCQELSCVPGNCVGVTCPGQEACADGRCVPTECAGVVCGAGAVCEQGRCVQAACVGVVCPAGTLCAQGRCVPTECGGVACPAGGACVAGACMEAACVGVRCSGVATCSEGACVGPGTDAGTSGADASAGADAEFSIAGRDAATTLDAGAPPDAAAAGPDAGAATDAGEPPDAAAPGPDAAPIDAGEPPDAALAGPDAAAPGADASIVDSPYNLVFVTSTSAQPAALGGPSGADTQCNTLAAQAGLPGPFVAWMSDGTVSAKDRLGAARGWVRLDGKPVADQVADLLAGRIWHPILIDDTFAPVLDDYGVITATKAAGTVTAATCAGYTSTASADGIGIGIASATAVAWTEDIGTSAQCDQARRHYCFGVGKAVPLAVQPATGPRAFTYSGNWVPSGGLSGADAACQGAADARGLGGTWLALISSTTVAAGTRFDRTGSPWVRLDGVALASSRTALLDGQALDAPPNLTETGSYLGANPVWVGASSPASTGSMASTCQDWTDGSSTNGALFGIANTVTRYFHFSFFPIYQSCSSGGYLYCLETP